MAAVCTRQTQQADDLAIFPGVPRIWEGVVPHRGQNRALRSLENFDRSPVIEMDESMNTLF